MFIKRYFTIPLFMICFFIFTGCSQTYIDNVIWSIYAYDESTNGISGLKVTYTLTTNGITETDVKYTDTNGYARSKEFTIYRQPLHIETITEVEKLFKITIEDVDGTNNGGEFVTTNFVVYDCLMEIFMQRK
ncbi:MAG: hypothetical protein ACP5Q5_02540 [Brevinematia bacterium]